MAITDLTGTTWKLNPKSAVDTRVKFQINGSMYSDNYSVTSSGGYFLLTTSTFIFVVNGAEGNIFPHLQFYYNDNKWREWGVSGYLLHFIIQKIYHGHLSTSMKACICNNFMIAQYSIECMYQFNSVQSLSCVQSL